MSHSPVLLRVKISVSFEGKTENFCKKVELRFLETAAARENTRRSLAVVMVR